jgi:hypothetical protein
MLSRGRVVLACVAFAWILCRSSVVCLGAAPPCSLEQGFRQPPEQTKPWVYWYWISDNISKQGISRDLEAMARVGIGEAFIGNVFLDDIPAGDVKVLSRKWWECVEHAVREGGRVGVNIGMFNCPGWSQSGGPWIEPGQAMRYLVSSETRIQGPVRVQQKLPEPKEPFQDVAVIAFPAPQSDAESLAWRSPRVTCTPAAADTEKIVDGNPDTAVAFPSGIGQGKDALVIEIALAEPLTARTLSMIPSESPWAAECELQVTDDTGQTRTVRSFKFDRSNMRVNVGPMPRGPVTISFPPVTAKCFRLVLTGVTGEAALAEIDLSPAARLEQFVEKQLGKMHPTPLPMWDTYLWPPQREPDRPALCVSRESVVDLTGNLAPDGVLRWDVPPGDWIVLRTGMTTTGTRNAPASPEGEGLEVDKMNREAARAHFDAFIGQLLRRMPPSDRKALKHVVADSYEMGSQNWTDGFATTFRKRYGYDPAPWLPVTTGRIVGSADQSDRFLWDLRRLVADRIAIDYVGGLRDLCRPHGLQLWLENYGHWGFPAEFLQYGGQSDRIGGEFWLTGSLGSIECRAASSAANTYGFPLVSSEAFTGGPPFRTVPSAMKARGDGAFCQGINHFVLHVYIHQPSDDRKPGVNAWFGTEFNRHNTWFGPGRAWVDYLRRSCFLLQQGTRVADVAYFIGEDTPKMTGIRHPELPPGRDFDYINAEVIQDKLSVEDGLLKLPHGTTYRVLVLPELPTMRPELLRKIRDLVHSGATVLGPPPSRSPSLEDYPRCDAQVGELAAEIWGGLELAKAGERRCGKGRVVWGKNLTEVFGTARVPRDFASTTPLRYTHRALGDTHIYFVANPEPQEVVAMATFRTGDRAPELWWPESGRIECPAVYHSVNGVVRMPVQLGPHGSVFVVFRDVAADTSRIISVNRNGRTLLDARAPAPRESETASGTDADVTDNFTLAVWAKPAAETTLHTEINRGVRGLNEPRNDALYPPHGSTFGDATHAGCGLAVGRNGVCVFEHGASYFAPVLVHAVTLEDWTHVAVVYRDARPRLYLDGELVHTGLKSTHTVHPGTAADGGGAPFRGELGGFQQLGRPLRDEEILGLIESMPRPGTRPPASALQLTRGEKGEIEARVWQSGTYVLERADGTVRKFDVASLPEPFQIAGPWQVEFGTGWGAPKSVTFEKLEDWSQRPEEGVKHYSGKATYRKNFMLPESWDGRSLFLDLGTVRDLAVVRLNGRDVGTLWIAPWRLDITAATRPGENLLEIDVVNPWNNRLVGDGGLPRQKRLTFLAKDTLRPNTPLLPAGLLGPVTIRASVRLDVQ